MTDAFAKASNEGDVILSVYRGGRLFQYQLRLSDAEKLGRELVKAAQNAASTKARIEWEKGSE